MHSPTERPLTPWAKTGLIVSTAAIIILFYAFTLLAAVILLLILAVEFALVLVLLRIGLAGWMAAIMGRHLRLVGILFRSLWLRSNSVQYSISLQKSDAPALFEILSSLAERFRLPVPDEVQLEMAVNAWVQLKGLRSGKGTTRLGIGYDLLSGLTVSEFEAVLAHEMAHAKLVQRGFKRVATSALIRCGSLMNALTYEVREGRGTKDLRRLAEMFRNATDQVTRTLARLVAAYSRQDEFEADRGAADVCGSSALRAALGKLPTLSEASARLPWRERVARLQSGEGFSQWFATQLTEKLASNEPLGKDVFDQYSTHPSLADRLAALPPGAPAQSDNTLAVSVLADADITAERLVDEIQRVGAIEEAKDSRALSKWTRRTHRKQKSSGLQILAGVIIVAAAIALISSMVLYITDRKALVGIFVSIPVIAAGLFIYRLGRYKDRRQLPIPGYDILIQAGERKFDFDSQSALEREFANLIGPERKKKRKLAILIDHAYAALAQGDYLRAHVAARTCLPFAKNSIEAHIAFSIAAAGVYQYDVATHALRFVHHHTGFESPSTTWCAAWASTLFGDYNRAEALLNQLLEKQPEEKTFLSLLAVTQARRGKYNSAIAAARRACSPTAPTKEHATLLISLLLDSGMLREAASQLNALHSDAETDAELQMQMVRLGLLTHKHAEADSWTVYLLQNPTGHKYLRLARFYQEARNLDRAAEFYNKILNDGYAPEAHLGLGQIEAERRHKERSPRAFPRRPEPQSHPRRKGRRPTPNLRPHSQRPLCALEDPAHCTAFIAKLQPLGTYCHQALVEHKLSDLRRRRTHREPLPHHYPARHGFRKPISTWPGAKHQRMNNRSARSSPGVQEDHVDLNKNSNKFWSEVQSQNHCTDRPRNSIWYRTSRALLNQLSMLMKPVRKVSSTISAVVKLALSRWNKSSGIWLALRWTARAYSIASRSRGE